MLVLLRVAAARAWLVVGLSVGGVKAAAAAGQPATQSFSMTRQETIELDDVNTLSCVVVEVVRILVA